MPRTTKTTRPSRDSSTRTKAWTPPNRLGTPAAPEGYKYRWVRHEVVGEADNSNVYERARQGYEPVMADELAGYPVDHLETGRHVGVVRSGDLMLTKVAIEIAQERQDYYEGQADTMMKAVNRELDNSFQSGDNMSKVDESSSEVSYNGNRHSGDGVPEFDD